MTGTLRLFVRTGWAATKKASTESSVISLVASEGGLKPPGSKDNWRCMAPDKLNNVELVEGSWPDSAEPFTPGFLYYGSRCVHAKDYPDREPQQGQ